VAEYTLTLLKRRVPPSVPGIMVSHSPVNKMSRGLCSTNEITCICCIQ
jgi:hypothetical protein